MIDSTLIISITCSLTFLFLLLWFRTKNAYQKKLWEEEKEKIFLQEQIKQHEQENERLILQLQEEKKLFEEKILHFKDTQQKWSDLFQSLSAEALRNNNESFLQLAQATLEKYQQKAHGELDKKELAIQQMMKPVKESLDKFENRVREIEQARIGAYSSIKEQIQYLMESQKQLRNETSNLVKALRTPNVRGRWGEIQLKRVIELAGMQDHCDFYEQEMAYNDEDKRLRPDLLVKLPGKKNIIIDAKAPLSAYFEAMECEDIEKKQALLKEHARLVKSHVSLLSKKNYWDQFNPTPEFVVLFLPGESFFSAALEQDPTLIESGVEQKIILATPTTLIALLRAIAYGWRQEKISKNAQQISDLGKELYKRIVDLAGHFSKLGKSLNGAVQAYNKAIGSLESRVLVTARRFKDLESIGGEEPLEVMEPIEQNSREIQVTEISEISQIENLINS